MMLHHRAISRAFGICCGLALVAAACAEPANNGSGPAAASTSGTTPGTTANGDSVPPTSPTAAQRWVSPLDQFLGFGSGKQPTEAEKAADDERVRQVEQQIATCMQALGFQYIPVEPNNEARDRKEALTTMSQADFAARYGYGITTLDFEDTGAANPNEAIVQAMTVPERSAYYQALYGDIVTVDANGNLIKDKGDHPAPPPGSESCGEKADTAVYGAPKDPDTAAQQSFRGLQDAMSALSDSIRQDPRLQTAMTAWTACMDAKGHHYTSFDDGQNEVQARADAVIQGRPMSEVDPAALSEVRAFEISVATDEYQCSIDYEKVHQTVQTEFEQTFIDEHRAELEQYRDAIAAGTAGKG